MTPRALACLLTVTVCACEAKSDEPEVVGAAATPFGISSAQRLQINRDKLQRKHLRPAEESPPKDEPEPEPEPEPAPTGEEIGPLVGLRAAHDVARAKVGAASLQWSKELAVVAQTWANSLAQNNCQLAHSQQSKYGENLYWASSGATSSQVVAAWLAEAEHYDAKTHTCAEGQICGHYTQVVWADTRYIGCGLASCGSQQVWVCNYDPHGNVMGQTPF